ncbi:MAG: tRNA epoxyqueuosine(34) reductase QueG [Ignavibacterium sp.]
MKITNEKIETLAKNLGFNLVGFAKVEILEEEGNKLEDWLNLNLNSGMKYMGKNIDKRKNVKLILEEAKSIISLGLNYYTDYEYSNDDKFGKVSRYAFGKDYHLIIWEKLELLIQQIKDIDSTFEGISYVDTGPVMDKVWAIRAGLGWMGKHTNVINREYGSWFFIASIITNYEFNYSQQIEDFCGSCTACIDACPTNAIVNEYVLDSNKCISYLTIENKEEEIQDEFIDKFENWIFGCDICQDVCPWNNKFSQKTLIKEFYPQNAELNINKILKMEEEEFKIRFSDSPIKRAKLKGLKRNAKFISHKHFLKKET